MSTKGPSKGYAWYVYANEIRRLITDDRPPGENRRLRRIIRQACMTAVLVDKLNNLPEPEWFILENKSRGKRRSWQQYVDYLSTPPRVPTFAPNPRSMFACDTIHYIDSEVGQRRHRLWEIHRTLGHKDCM